MTDQFSKALDIMNRAVTGHYQPGARENVAYLTSTERRREFEPHPPVHDNRDNMEVSQQYCFQAGVWYIQSSFAYLLKFIYTTITHRYK